MPFSQLREDGIFIIYDTYQKRPMCIERILSAPGKAGRFSIELYRYVNSKGANAGQ